MGLISLFVLFVLSHLLLHLSAEMKYHPHCPPFECGKLNSIGFPFAKTTHPECGLVTVNCSNFEDPEIELNGKWYHVESISQANNITIYDERLEHFPYEKCELFYNITPPTTPSISYHLSYNITLLGCKETLNQSYSKYFDQTKCNDFNIYFNLSQDSLPSSPSNCSVVQLPIENDRSRVAFWFYFEARLGHKRIQCISGGGWSMTDAKGMLDCVNGGNTGSPRKNNSRGNNSSPGNNNWPEYNSFPLKLVVGIGGSVILITICLGLYVIRRCYKQKHESSHLLSTNTLDYSKSDLEGGSVYFGVSIFPYSELEEATNYFDGDNELGDGGFGTVYYGKLKDGRDVAVKRLYEHNYKRVKQFLNEVEILARLRHKNLVTLYGCTSRRSRELLLVYEYIPNGTIADHLHGDRAESGSLTWATRMNIALETASALVYLHASDIIHRDVKTNNILLDNNFCVKVADFGLSRLFPNDVTHVSTAPQGTPGYVDPEYHQCYQLTVKSDVYSFGVVLIELISSMPAVDISRHRQDINLSNLAVNKIQKGEFSELVDSTLGFESDETVRRMMVQVAQLAFRCLQQENDLRPSMDEVLEALKKIESGTTTTTLMKRLIC